MWRVDWRRMQPLEFVRLLGGRQNLRGRAEPDPTTELDVSEGFCMGLSCNCDYATYSRKASS